MKWVMHMNHSVNKKTQASPNKDLNQIAIVGSTNVYNFGALTTNFALWSKLREFGYMADLVPLPRTIYESDSKYKIPELVIREQLGEDFADRYIPKMYNLKEIRSLLYNCYRVFITGSDQTLSPYCFFSEVATLGWVADRTPRLSYASSYGVSGTNITSPYMFDQVTSALAHYGRVSVREAEAVELLGSYGIEATHTLEPVLLHSAEFWTGYAVKRETVGHIFAYILDPKPEIDLLLGFARGKLKFDIEQFGEMWFGGTVNERIGSIMNSNFVITDSFHGMCFAIIFKKPFIAVINKARGAMRFTDLAKKLHLESRLVESVGEALARHDLFAAFDWSECENILKNFRDESIEWLKEALIWAFENASESPKYERIVDKSLIWYGAGLGAKRLMLFLDRLRLPYPFKIWDRSAFTDRELKGVLVTKPDFESLRGRCDIKVVITIENMAVNFEVAKEIKNYGFENIITFDEIDRQFRQILKEKCVTGV